MARKSRGEEEKTASTWLATYGDMVSLLLCFFILLYSFSSVDSQKFKQVVISLQEALGGILMGGGAITDGIDAGGSEVEIAQMEDVLAEIQQYIEENGLQGAVVAEYEERGVVIRFMDTVLFDLAKANLKPDSVHILDKLAQVLLKVPNQVAIEGHTDNLPIQTAEFPSNWWLSTARANRVAEYLISGHDVAPERVSVVGYGEFRPLQPNTSAANRAKNRRVEILIKRTEIGAIEPR